MIIIYNYGKIEVLHLNMERRKHKRIYINEKAQITLDDKVYKGYIVDTSDGGINFMLTSPFHVRDETAHNAVAELSSGKIEHLKCEIVWTKKGLNTGNTIALGMKIINPSNEYRDWIKNLLDNSLND
jgi:hypothetical protein